MSEKSSSDIKQSPILGNAIDQETGKAIDPVCGMTVHRHAFYKHIHDNKLYKFCNEDCLKDFIANPIKYSK